MAVNPDVIVTFIIHFLVAGIIVWLLVYVIMPRYARAVTRLLAVSLTAQRIVDTGRRGHGALNPLLPALFSGVSIAYSTASCVHIKELH